MSENEPSPIIVCCASEIEIKPLLKNHKFAFQSHGAPFPLAVHTGSCESEKILLLITGIGKAASLQSGWWIIQQNPKLILNLGYAGGLKSSLKFGDFIFPSEIKIRSGEKMICNNGADFPALKSSGTLLTSETIIQTKEEKTSLSSSADAVDMEAYYLGLAAQSLHIPFYCVKIISDDAAENFPIDLSKTIVNGRVDPMKVMAAAVKKISGILFLIKFNLRSSNLSKNLCGFVFSDGAVFKC